MYVETWKLVAVGSYIFVCGACARSQWSEFETEGVTGKLVGAVGALVTGAAMAAWVWMACAVPIVVVGAIAEAL